MKKILIICFLFSSFLSFTQESDFNDDGTPSNYAKRKLFVVTLNNSKNDSLSFDIENRDLIINTTADIRKFLVEKDEKQKIALSQSFNKLLSQIHGLKNIITSLQDVEFENIIIKTNILFDYEARRYYYKFSCAEIKNFP